MKAKLHLALFILFGLFALQVQAQTPDANNILYVNINVPNGGNGSGNSWANAIPQLADALKWARQQNNFTSGNPLKIYVAKGTYKPMYNAKDGGYTIDGGRDNAFVMVKNVQLYGGFDPGNGIVNLTHNRIIPSTIDQSPADGTILSGDVNGNDVVSGWGNTLSITGNSENNYHVVVAAGAMDNAKLDGFSIRYANAITAGNITINSVDVDRGYGGGMSNYSSSPALINCSFSSNMGAMGGGMLNFMASPTLTNCFFTANQSNGAGGIHNYYLSNPVFTNCIISGNLGTAETACGGIKNTNSSSTLTRCTITENATGSTGTGGGMGNYLNIIGGNLSPIVLTNCTISGNKANYGGGIYHYGDAANLVLVNCVITGNSAFTSGGALYHTYNGSGTYTNVTIANNGATGIYFSRGSATFQNSLLWEAITLVDGGTYTSKYSLIKDKTDATNGNINAGGLNVNNIFMDYGNGNYIPKNGGPAADAGLNSLYTMAGGNLLNDKDMGGNKRLVNSTIDLGAYESLGIVPDANRILYVDANATGTGRGNSWANAVVQLADAFTAAKQDGSVGSIYVAKGTYYPTGSQNGTDRNATFLIPQRGGVKLYGGYPNGGGTRNIKSNATILSGDIGTANNNSDNSYHVIIMTNTSASADSVVIDGFTIRDGNANSTGSPYSYNGNVTNQNEGAGILLRQNSNLGTKVAIRNCTITSNNANASGAGVYLWQTSPAISNTIIANNTTTGSGAGLFLFEAPSLLLINSLVNNNSAANGGGIYSNNAASQPKIVNSTFAGNMASGNGNSVYNTNSSTMTVANSILWSSNAAKNNFNDATLNISYSNVQQTSGIYIGTGNINTDPLFVDAAGGNYSLGIGSLFISIGNNTAYTTSGGNLSTDKDLAGNVRLFGGIIDMGAYEFVPSSLLYVDNSVAASGDGSSWNKALKNLSDAFTAASQYSNISTIYVAKGTYYTTGVQNGTDRNATFLIPQRGGIKIYGGYPNGGGTRNVIANPTVLSGDIGTANNNSDNSYHVMVMTNTSASADSVVVDGFAITGGNANSTEAAYTYNGNGTNQNEGGGILLRQNNNLSNVAIRNCTITGNASLNNAGGIYLWETSPVISNSVIANNSTGGSGGGVFMYGAKTTRFINTVFNGNSAVNGGGLFNSDVVALSKITNCTFWGNMASGNGTSIYNTNAATLTIANSILWSGNGAKNVFNEATLNISYSDVQQNNGVYIGVGNLNIDPVFANAANDDFTLNNTSPLLNVGSNSAYIAAGGNTTVDKDLAGNARIYNGGMIDLGAYEYQGNPVVLPVSLVSFTAKADGNYAKLQWQTTNEVNHKGFEIYRSGDTSTSSVGQFVKIGEVPATFNSQLSTFHYTDKTPLNGTNYYKLVQIDNDGKATELGVRTVTFNFQPLTFNLYPNPTENQITASFAAGSYTQLQVADVNGKVLQQISISTTESNKILSLGQYPKGIYIIRLSGKGVSETRKMVRE